MTLTPGMSSVRDLLIKLQRDADLLEDEVTNDRFFNFVITGYSMIDWVKHDPSVPIGAKTHIAIQGLRSDRWLTVCGDLATASKHFKLTHRVPVVASTDSSRGYNLGRYGKGGYGIGEASIDVELNDGTKFGCLDLVRGVLSTWSSFFAIHSI
jgi:hypothetical protein